MTNTHRVKAVGRRIGTPKPQPPEPTEEEALAACVAFINWELGPDDGTPNPLDALPVDRSIPDHGAIDSALEQILAALDAQGDGRYPAG